MPEIASAQGFLEMVAKGLQAILNAFSGDLLRRSRDAHAELAVFGFDAHEDVIDRIDAFVGDGVRTCQLEPIEPVTGSRDLHRLLRFKGLKKAGFWRI